MHDARYWIDTLDMQKHPEGGYYREVYRSGHRVAREHLAGDFTGDRSLATSILFLLDGDDFSALHRIKQDELWYFHCGTALNVHIIGSGGQYSCLTVGPNPGSGHQLQAVVKARSVFGAALIDTASYALVGCMCAPGFDFADLELPPRHELLRAFPQHAGVIERLTRS